LPPDADVAGRRVPGGQPIALAESVVTQQAGSRIAVESGATLAVVASRGGSVTLAQDANRFDGGLAVLSGPAYGTAWSPNLVTPSFGGGTHAMQGRVQVAGGTLRLGGAGIEADVVSIRADQVATPGGSAIVARLPYDVLAGPAASLPGLTLALTPSSFGIANPYGLAPGQELRVQVGGGSGSANAGLLSVLPRLGASGTTSVVLVGPAVVPGFGGYGFFYDGAGEAAAIPVSYNGAAAIAPPAGGAASEVVRATISAATQVNDAARIDRIDDVTQPDNPAPTLRAGGVTRTGPTRPLTQGVGGPTLPAGCVPTNGGGGC